MHFGTDFNLNNNKKKRLSVIFLTTNSHFFKNLNYFILLSTEILLFFTAKDSAIQIHAATLSTVPGMIHGLI